MSCLCTIFLSLVSLLMGFPGGSAVKNLPAKAKDAGDTGSIPGRSPGEGNGNSLQYSCQYNSKTRGAWWATSHGLQRVGNDWTSTQSFWKYLFLFVWSSQRIGVENIYILWYLASKDFFVCFALQINWELFLVLSLQNH